MKPCGGTPVFPLFVAPAVISVGIPSFFLNSFSTVITPEGFVV
jgi:hypothetical protein